jgi:hypothetical protein
MKTKTFQQAIVYCPDGQQLHVDQACSGFHPHCESQCKYCTGGAFRCTNGTECLLPARVSWEIAKVNLHHCFRSAMGFRTVPMDQMNCAVRTLPWTVMMIFVDATDLKIVLMAEMSGTVRTDAKPKQWLA